MNDYDFIFKLVGMGCLTLITIVACIKTIKAPIDKFGGGDEYSKDEQVNKEINKHITEMKRKSLFKFNTSSDIIIVLSVSLIAHFFVPDVLTNQVTLLIVAACIVGLGIKIGTNDLK